MNINRKIRGSIKRILSEALGVPDKIIETSEKLYNDIFYKIKTLKKEKFKKPEGVNFVLTNNYEVSDVTFNKVDMNIAIQPHNGVDEFILAWSRIGSRHKLDHNNLRVLTVDSGGVIDLSMNFVAHPDWEYSEFLEYFSSNKNFLVSKIAHELMHSFERSKKPSYKAENLSDYGAYSGLRFGVPSIDRFIQSLYYIHQFENVVRPTEVATLLKLNQVQKNNFIEFLKSNETYSRLKKIYNFDIDKFKSKILRDINYVDKVLEQGGELGKYKTNEEKIDRILELLLINLINTKMENLEDLIATSPFEKIFGFSGDKAMKMEKYLKSLGRFKTPDQFLKNEQKNFKEISLKMMKKIAKLYDMTGNNITKESINDWDLYHKINETEKKNPITNKLKYPITITANKKLKKPNGVFHINR